jgi:hypothetical protein
MKAKLQFFALVAVLIISNAVTAQAEGKSDKTAKIGSLVAMKHDGRTILVSEHAVITHLENGDSLAFSHKGKTDVNALVAMRHNDRIIYVNAPAVELHLKRGATLLAGTVRK